MPDWLTGILCSLGLHRWSTWEDKDMSWRDLEVEGRICAWCATVQNRCGKRVGHA